MIVSLSVLLLGACLSSSIDEDDEATAPHGSGANRSSADEGSDMESGSADDDNATLSDQEAGVALNVSDGAEKPSCKQSFAQSVRAFRDYLACIFAGDPPSRCSHIVTC